VAGSFKSKEHWDFLQDLLMTKTKLEYQAVLTGRQNILQDINVMVRDSDLKGENAVQDLTTQYKEKVLPKYIEKEDPDSVVA